MFGLPRSVHNEHDRQRQVSSETLLPIFQMKRPDRSRSRKADVRNIPCDLEPEGFVRVGWQVHRPSGEIRISRPSASSVMAHSTPSGPSWTSRMR